MADGPRRPPREGWASGDLFVMACASVVFACGFLRFGSSGKTQDTPPAPALRLDPNTAPEGALAALPGMGPVLRKRFIEAREEGPFESLVDIDVRVKGVGPKTIDQWRPLLRIESGDVDRAVAPGRHRRP